MEQVCIHAAFILKPDECKLVPYNVYIYPCIHTMYLPWFTSESKEILIEPCEVSIGPKIEHYFLVTVGSPHRNDLPSETFLLIDNKSCP